MVSSSFFYCKKGVMYEQIRTTKTRVKRNKNTTRRSNKDKRIQRNT